MRLVSEVGAWYNRVTGDRVPWTNAYGLGRSLIAFGTLLTLICNPYQLLFRPSAGLTGIVSCDALARHLSICCIVPADKLPLAQIVAAVILAAVVIGWMPRLTAIPHWWISFSFYTSARDGDGGDQFAALITFLILPIALTDTRVWHWERVKTRVTMTRSTIAFLALWITQIQIAIVYFDSFVEKLRVAEWADGTELYYVLHNNLFGAPHYLSFVLEPLSTSAAIVVVTWSVLCVEFLLGINIFLPVWARRLVLMAGLTFHIMIALTLGITSFAIIMTGALFLGLSPGGLTLREFLNVPQRIQHLPKMSEERATSAA